MMYNRYVPRPDGSYSKNRVPDQSPKSQSRPKPPPSPPPQQEQCAYSPPHREQEKSPNPLGFLRQLLGKDFDTGDLIVILLLLLMAGDSQEERNNAILTIALYFLM